MSVCKYFYFFAIEDQIFHLVDLLIVSFYFFLFGYWNVFCSHELINVRLLSLEAGFFCASFIMFFFLRFRCFVSSTASLSCDGDKLTKPTMMLIKLLSLLLLLLPFNFFSFFFKPCFSYCCSLLLFALAGIKAKCDGKENAVLHFSTVTLSTICEVNSV